MVVKRNVGTLQYRIRAASLVMNVHASISDDIKFFDTMIRNNDRVGANLLIHEEGWEILIDK